MNRKEILNHFTEIMDEMIGTSDFYKVYFQNGYVLDKAMRYSSNIELCTGISRGCIIDNQYDYVVKFDIGGGDCCRRELAIYADAQLQHIGHFFAKPEYIGTYVKTICFYDTNDLSDQYGIWIETKELLETIKLARKDHLKKNLITISIPLFAYPRATQVIYTRYTTDDEIIAKNSTSPLNEFYRAIAASFIHDYGEEGYNILTDFLYEWDIGDIHFGNVGDLNNKICIIDYAGETNNVSELSRYS